MTGSLNLDFATPIIAVRMTLGIVLVTFSALKLRFPKIELKLRISRYQFLPLWLVSLLANFIIPLEMIVGFMLLLNIVPILAAWMSSLMFVAFTFIIIESMTRGQIGRDCGCGVPGRLGRVGYPVLGRNLLLLISSVWLVISLPRESTQLDLSAGIQPLKSVIATGVSLLLH